VDSCSEDNEMERLRADVKEIKEGLKGVEKAISSLAVVEERLTHFLATLVRTEEWVRGHETRIRELEKAEPRQTRAADLVERAMVGLVVAAAAFLLGKYGVHL